MDNYATGSFNRFYLEQARNIRGISEYDNYKIYVNTPAEDRCKLDKNVIRDYEAIVNVINIMQSYGSNHWWVLLDTQDSKGIPKDAAEKKQLADLRRKARVHYQIFECGLDTMLIQPGQLINDINDLLQHSGKTITSWILKNPFLFEFYKYDIKRILDKDAVFQNYLCTINSE